MKKIVYLLVLLLFIQKLLPLTTFNRLTSFNIIINILYICIKQTYLYLYPSPVNEKWTCQKEKERDKNVYKGEFKYI